MTKKVSDERKEKYPIREGQENNSILNEKHPHGKHSYPLPTEKDKQEKNQPEFIEPVSNKKNKNQS